MKSNLGLLARSGGAFGIGVTEFAPMGLPLGKSADPLQFLIQR